VLDALGLGNAKYYDIIRQLAFLAFANLVVSLFGLTFFGPVYIQAKGDEEVKCKDDTLRSSRSSKTAHPRLMPLVKIV
jgi:hypothetical protein